MLHSSCGRVVSWVASSRPSRTPKYAKPFCAPVGLSPWISLVSTPIVPGKSLARRGVVPPTFGVGVAAGVGVGVDVGVAVGFGVGVGVAEGAGVGDGFLPETVIAIGLAVPSPIG